MLPVLRECEGLIEFLMLLELGYQDKKREEIFIEY